MAEEGAESVECVNITLYFGAIPPPKKPRARGHRGSVSSVVQEAAHPQAAGEGGQGSRPATGQRPETAGSKPADAAEEPPAEPEEPGLPEPRSILLNCNVPVLILLHYACKCYLREEPAAAAQEGIGPDTPCTMFDIATLEGKVARLGESATVEQRAAELVEARAEYVLVLKKESEDGEATFKPLCPKHAEVECS